MRTDALKAKTYVHRMINDPTSELVVRPPRINAMGSGAIYHKRLRWRDWGEVRAKARGTVCFPRVGNCDRERLRLTDRMRIGDRWVYGCLVRKAPGETKICLPEAY